MKWIQEFGARAIATMVLILIVVALVLFGTSQCSKRRSLDAQSKVTQGQGDAFHNSASDAINTQGGVSQRQGQSDDLTRSNEKDIRNAPGSNAPVDPAARDAGLRALCKRTAYRDNPKCRVFQPHTE